MEVAPAVLMQHGAGDVGAGVADLLAVLELADDLAEGAAVEGGLAAVIGEAVLELHAQRSAQRVEAEDRVGPFQVDLVDREAGDQVPVHRVAERVVEAGAVDVDRQALRRPLQGGGLEAMVEQGRLLGVAGGGVEVHAADLLVERPQGVGGAVAGDVVAVEHVGFGRQLVAVDAGPQQGAAADDVDCRQDKLGGRRTGGGVGYRLGEGDCRHQYGNGRDRRDCGGQRQDSHYVPPRLFLLLQTVRCIVHPETTVRPGDAAIMKLPDVARRRSVREPLSCGSRLGPCLRRGEQPRGLAADQAAVSQPLPDGQDG